MKNLFVLFMLVSTISKAQSPLSSKNPDKPTKSATRSDLGKNLIAFSPVGIGFTSSHQESPDVTIGLSYERISKNGYIGVKIPVIASLYNPYYYVFPTIKLYPMKQGVASYAIGPQVLIASGTVKVPVQSSSYFGIVQLISKERKQFGFMLNNSFNFTIAKHVYVSLDLSLGGVYYDNAPNAIVNPNVDFFGSPSSAKSSISPCTHMGFGMGYRF